MGIENGTGTGTEIGTEIGTGDCEPGLRLGSEKEEVYFSYR